MSENPEIEELKETPTEAPKEDGVALVEALRAAGVETPEQVQNILTASSQAGQLANIVGDLRRKVDDLETIKAVPPTQDLEYQEGQPIDMQGMIEQGVEKGMRKINKENIQAQATAQQAVSMEMAKIYADQDYKILEIQDIWNKHSNNPNVVMLVNSGRSTITDEWNKVVKSYLRGMNKQSADFIENNTLTPAATVAPHVEGNQPGVPGIDQDTDRAESLKQIRDASTGSDDDLEKLVSVILAPAE